MHCELLLYLYGEKLGFLVQKLFHVSVRHCVQFDLLLQLRAQLQSIESRYKAEIDDLNERLAESRRKSQEMENELRREIASLKAIIKDLEARLGANVFFQ